MCVFVCGCVYARGPLIDTRFCGVDSLKATRASNPKGPNTLNGDKTAISVFEKLLIVFANNDQFNVVSLSYGTRTECTAYFRIFFYFASPLKPQTRLPEIFFFISERMKSNTLIGNEGRAERVDSPGKN